MGNQPSNELWANVYKLKSKELLDYGDAVTEKVQMGELDMTDAKAMAKFKEDFRASIASDREKLVEALWTSYANKKGTFGQAEGRNLIKDALKEGKLHLPEIIVKYTEVSVTRALADKITPLMTDRESRPLWEHSLARIRRDVAERVRNEMTDKSNDANAYGDKLVARLVAGEGKGDKKDVKDIPALAAEDPKFDSKATVEKAPFLKLFNAVYDIVLQTQELMQSVPAQFQSFAEMEVRNIPERVIRKLEEEEEALEAAKAGKKPEAKDAKAPAKKA